MQKKKPGVIVLNVNGVGYVLNCPADLARRFEVGDDAAFHVEMKTTENSSILYGFETEQDQELFVQLNKVQAVGGKSALSVLSALGFVGFCNAVVDNDEGLVCQAEGVGKKTAARIIADLKSFAEEHAQPALPNGVDAARVRGVEKAVVAALTQMGFNKKDSETAFGAVVENHMAQDDLVAGSMVKSCLRELGGQPSAS
ncbi:Holliday junction DNA helicase RuvA [Salipiger mucosus DSM 16094]|uniref:Holliday junction branch migration complex subunit RuvA n=1 Tax=Salipiger mucosus DSM 16094 TaxID=1123237 RepID=S9RIQ5_9RHOB|nr:Holliday junction DNA helicase RuvA [Salipiger mucosus DSM 16094]